MNQSNAFRPRAARSPQAMAARQRGAALVVGLVLMLVLTVLGVSGMNMASLELTMAGNTQAHQAAFQAAETGIDIPLGQGGFDTAAPSTLPATPLGDGSYSATSVTACMTTTPAAGFTIGAFQAFHFDIVSVGTGPRNANSTHNQSFFVVGPGGGPGC